MLTEYNAVMRECLQEILNLQLSDDQQHQSSLPVKSAGLGIRRATDLALPAFLASAHGSNSGVLRLLDGLALDEEYSEVAAGEDLWKGLFEEDFTLLSQQTRPCKQNGTQFYTITSTTISCQGRPCQLRELDY